MRRIKQITFRTNSGSTVSYIAPAAESAYRSYQHTIARDEKYVEVHWSEGIDVIKLDSVEIVELEFHEDEQFEQLREELSSGSTEEI
mgnify:CR=1 FL=1